MAIRTVSVDLRLNATAYLTAGGRVLALNNDIDDSFNRITASSNTAAAGTRDMSDALRSMSTRALLAERRVHNLREEVDRLIAAQAALRAGGPIPPIPGGAGGAGRMGGGLFGMLLRGISSLSPAAKAGLGTAGAIIAAALASAIGASLNALLLTAVGGIVLGIGVTLAAKFSNVVQAAFSDAFRPIGKEIVAFSMMFEGPLVRSARIFGDAWSDVSQDVRGLFAEAGEWIEPLSEGIANMVREMMPGLRSAMTAAGPVIKELARDLPALGRGISHFFESLSQGDGAVKGMRFTIMALVGALALLGNTIEFLSDTFDVLTEWGETFYGFFASIPVIGKIFEPFADFFEMLNRDGTGAMRNIGDASGPAADGLYRTGAAATEADKAMQRLNDSMNETFQTMTGSLDAAIAFEEAIDRMTEAVRENGRSLDITTEKGRENVKVIDDVARKAWAVREAAIAAAGGQHASASAVAAANAQFQAQINQLAGLMRQLGFTEGAIQGLLGNWYALVNAPNANKSVTVTTYYRQSGSGPPVASSGQPVKRPGMNVFYRHGGIAYADQGLLNLTGKAGIAPGSRTMYGFGEPGNKEAFISATAGRYRSMAIGAEAMRWHGAAVVPNEAMRGGGGPVEIKLAFVSSGSGTNWLTQAIDTAVGNGSLALKAMPANNYRVQVDRGI